MILAVIQDGAEVHDGESRQESAGSGIANALLDRGNPVLGDRTAKDIVDEFDAFAALDGLHLDAADSKLAVPAGLFFVLAFDVSLAANGFSVRNFGRLQGEVNVIALVELGDDDLDMLLAGAGEQELLGLRIAHET